MSDNVKDRWDIDKGWSSWPNALTPVALRLNKYPTAFGILQFLNQNQFADERPFKIKKGAIGHALGRGRTQVSNELKRLESMGYIVKSYDIQSGQTLHDMRPFYVFAKSKLANRSPSAVLTVPRLVDTAWLDEAELDDDHLFNKQRK